MNKLELYEQKKKELQEQLKNKEVDLKTYNSLLNMLQDKYLK